MSVNIHKYFSIPWVTFCASWKKWPHVGICYFTHGNEPVGSKIGEYLLNEYNISQKLIRWTISFIQVNIHASTCCKRYVDHNMNRIRNKPFEDDSYEFHRREELKSYLDHLDVLIDIHSTSKPSPCIGITHKTHIHKLQVFFSGAQIRAGDMQQQGALIGYMIAQGKDGYGIEAGSHHDPRGYQQGIINVCNLLAYYELIAEKVVINKKPTVYEFLEEIYCQDTSFRYAQPFSDLTSIKPAAIIACETHRTIINPYTDDNIYFGLASKHPRVGDGAWFFFRKT